MVSVVAGAALLSGCVAADLVNLAVHTTEEGFSVKYFPKLERGVAIEPSLKAVTAMPYKRHFLREEGKCQFDGVVVPWERTWPVPVQSGDSGSQNMLPPEPGKIAGYASVIYQRTCPNAAPESILHVGIQGTGVFAKPFIISANSMAAQDVMDTPVGNRPQWLSQVIKRLVDLAPTHSAAKQAVVIAQDKLVEASPDMASAIKAMVQ
ncbi:hypothetical protein [Acidovorax sp. SRB_14]|uniref:hypothetical protein n=1 Tax=Acidovorax sp. SRB_14 TaxID=1962699 RepID=UPI0015641962|nr:hypothetical protein [Acidovorax sp. SRB_14]